VTRSFSAERPVVNGLRRRFTRDQAAKKLGSCDSTRRQDGNEDGLEMADAKRKD
jgi:hypothetical protein